ncbi:MAG: hypothetical protein IJX71_01645, partial [Oscillospiraceae bacterium]|nr:hypothetical protein [Oscillospiraceae bacterium]
YTPQTTHWNGYDSFYAFGTTTDETVLSASANGVYDKLWSKVNVIPANNVYYEDDFVTSEETGTVGIEYSADWKVDGATGKQVENANGDVQGWETTLSNDTTFSDGAAHVAEAGATATFTFTGTGVDIYSRTNLQSGMVVGMLYTGDSAAGTVTKLLMIDNYAQSGDYYQIPTLSFSDLTYGTYTVKLAVNKVKEMNDDGTYADTYRSTYYLDGIRVYNPIQNLEAEDTTVQDAYTEKDAEGNVTGTELNAVFTEVRNILIDNSTYDAEGENTGAVFIDQMTYDDANSSTNAEIGTYKDYGPKNEVYLATGQSITFKVDDTSDNNTYQIGLKAPEGSGTKAAFSNGTGANYETEIAHTTDLYYKVVPADGYITIQNIGENLLSVTKIKMTGADTASGIALLSMTEEEAVAEVSAFSLRTAVAYDAAPEEEVPETPVEPEEPAEPETPEEPETPDVDIEIDNPEPAPQKPAQNEALKNLVKNLFKKISGWFGR